MYKSVQQKNSELSRALRIAAACFAKAGFVTDTGNGSPKAIELWFLQKAREELKREAPGS